MSISNHILPAPIYKYRLTRDVMNAMKVGASSISFSSVIFLSFQGYPIDETYIKEPDLILIHTPHYFRLQIRTLFKEIVSKRLNVQKQVKFCSFTTESFFEGGRGKHLQIREDFGYYHGRDVCLWKVQEGLLDKLAFKRFHSPSDNTQQVLHGSRSS